MSSTRWALDTLRRLGLPVEREVAGAQRHIWRGPSHGGARTLRYLQGHASHQPRPRGAVGEHERDLACVSRLRVACDRGPLNTTVSGGLLSEKSNSYGHLWGLYV